MTTRYFPAAKIAYWYFRLNGFLTIENFVVHPKVGEQQSQRTEADLCGVRFPNRREMDMDDDKPFQRKSAKPLFVIAEVASAGRRGPVHEGCPGFRLLSRERRYGRRMTPSRSTSIWSGPFGT
jgi:hypothetical protein